MEKEKSISEHLKRIFVSNNRETQFNSICSMEKKTGIKGSDFIFRFNMGPNLIMKLFC